MSEVIEPGLGGYETSVQYRGARVAASAEAGILFGPMSQAAEQSRQKRAEERVIDATFAVASSRGLANAISQAKIAREESTVGSSDIPPVTKIIKEKE